MTWFTDLTGFTDDTPEAVARNLVLDGEVLVSNVNGRQYGAGHFAMTPLSDLQALPLKGQGTTTVCEIVADVQGLHIDPANAGAVFQVASQFNMLEMVSPKVSPLDGVAIYEHDHTQGPACAIACGAGTVFRNYFVEIGGGIGQTADRQLDGLSGIADILANSVHGYWRMLNGYVVPPLNGLERLTDRLATMTEGERQALCGALQVGVHKDVEVTLDNAGHCVTQVYCSALPVAYSDAPSAQWERFARLILEAAYEATLLAACQNLARTGNSCVFLTLLGGGAFGNRMEWIVDAAVRALGIVKNAGLDVRFVSYGAPNQAVAEIVATFETDKARK